MAAGGRGGYGRRDWEAVVTTELVLGAPAESGGVVSGGNGDRLMPSSSEEVSSIPFIYYYYSMMRWNHLTSHSSYTLLYDKVEKVTVENDGFRGGDVLVPSDYDETGGVAKVDVSNNT